MCADYDAREARPGPATYRSRYECLGGVGGFGLAI
jgi:hypothetical protein